MIYCAIAPRLCVKAGVAAPLVGIFQFWRGAGAGAGQQQREDQGAHLAALILGKGHSQMSGNGVVQALNVLHR